MITTANDPAVLPLPRAGEGRGEGEREALGVREGPVTPYLAKPQQARHSRAGGNPETSSWQIKRLRDFARTASGGTPKRDRPQFYDGPIRWIKSGELRDGVVREAEEGITQLGLDSSSAKIFPKGTLCIALYGATVGRLGILDIEAATNQAVCGIFPSEDVDNKYLFYFLFSRRGALIREAKGGAQPNISQEIIRDLRVPVPPLAEQRRIVAELETQLTRLDASVAGLKRVQANLKRYRASVLKAACEGRLVSTEAELAHREGRTFESGAHLVANIRAMRGASQRTKGKAKEAIEPDALDTLKVPEGWAVVSVDQLCGHITSGSRDWSQFYGKGTGTFILAQNVRPLKLDLSERQTVDAPVGDAEAERTKVQFGDLLVTIVGAKTGDVCRVPIDLSEHYVCQSVALLRPVTLAVSKFVEFFLASAENGQAIWKRYLYGQGRPHLSFEQLKMTPIPLPPLAEQHRIVAEVERRISVIEELEDTVAANLKRAERLRQSILRRAFTESRTEDVPAASSEAVATPAAQKPNRHFARALLSAEIVHLLHRESSFGRVKHQKIFHLAEHIARMPEIQGQYHREAAGPLDNKLIYANEAELKKQQWYEQVPREGYDHSYRSMSKAGGHAKYLERYWLDRLETIRKLIERMRSWDTERCEIFSTTYAAWNDLLLWGREPTEDAIIHEVLNRWHESKRRITEDRWRKAIGWIKREGYEPTGFGQPTHLPA